MTTDLNKLATAIAKIDDPEIIAMILRAAVPTQPQPTATITPRRTRAPRGKVRTANSYGRWTEAEIERLRELVAAGKSSRTIGSIIGRSPKSVDHARRKFVGADV